MGAADPARTPPSPRGMGHPWPPPQPLSRPGGQLWHWYLWLCRQWSSRCSSSGSTRRGRHTGTCAARRSHCHSGPRRSLQESRVSAGRGTRGGQWGRHLHPSLAPGGESKCGHIAAGGTPPLHGYPPTLGATAAPLPAPTQVLLGQEPRTRLCRSPSSTPAVRLQDGQGFAQAPPIPVCCLLAFLPCCEV